GGEVGVEVRGGVAGLDALIVPVGGGGMISGVTIAAKGLKPAIRIIGAEPLGADDAARSKRGGQFVPQTGPNTIADGLLTSLGKLTWPVVRDLVDEIITPTEEEIVAAMRLIFEGGKLVIEPSAGVGVAVALHGSLRNRPGLSKVGVVLCGGNVNLDKLPWA